MSAFFDHPRVEDQVNLRKGHRTAPGSDQALMVNEKPQINADERELEEAQLAFSSATSAFVGDALSFRGTSNWSAEADPTRDGTGVGVGVGVPHSGQTPLALPRRS